LKRYIVSADARADLDEIWGYIGGRSSGETAATFFWRLSFTSLAQSPSAGVAVPGLGEESVRKFPVGNYLIYYRPMRAKVMILRVVHRKRIQLRALQSDPRRPPRA
jgi:toxin ParE1/3/4